MGDAKIWLDVACNNPGNGIFAYRAQQLQVSTWDGQEVEFEANGRAPLFREGGKGIKLRRRWYPVLEAREWCGNWCWNRYALAPDIIADLLSHIHTAAAFDCTCGPCDLYDDWRNPRGINRDLWLANLWGRHSIGVAANG